MIKELTRMHKTLFPLFTLLVMILGCEKKELKNQIHYLQDEVDGLEVELKDLEKENKSLQSELKNISHLEKELKAMSTQLIITKMIFI